MNIKYMLEFIEQIPKNNKVCIYGTGKRGVQLRELIETNRSDIYIVCYLDSFKGGNLDGLKVINKNELKESSLVYDLILICTSTPEDIVTFLEKNSLKKFKVLQRPITYQGWGLISENTVPWDGGNGNEFFLKAQEDMKATFDFSGHVMSDDMDTLMWRHWLISYSIRHVVEFSKCKDLELVECGVANGLTAFFALRELKGLQGLGKVDNFKIHLYDSWLPIREDDLLSTEKGLAGGYDDINLDKTKNNLAEFSEDTAYYKGYIPEIFESKPVSIDSVAYLHIDLNAAKPTQAALEYYYSKVMRGGVILFDDYGWDSYRETKEMIDNFFKDKPGMLMPLPTPQAIYYR
jgi:O-methyltransferase